MNSHWQANRQTFYFIHLLIEILKYRNYKMKHKILRLYFSIQIKYTFICNILSIEVFISKQLLKISVITKQYVPAKKRPLR